MGPLQLLLLAACAHAQTQIVASKAKVVIDLAEGIEASFQSHMTSRNDECTGYNTCASQLPESACDPSWGATEGCDCGGRRIDTNNFVIKASSSVTADADIKNAVCYSEDARSTIVDIYTNQSGSVKWLYYGSSEGVLVNYPAFLWGWSCGSCSDSYDPRLRPWWVMGATGPKDVVLMIDTSGSMEAQNRMENAKAAATTVVTSLTNIDYLAVIDFDSDAVSENTYLVPAESNYRDRMNTFIAGMKDEGGTKYNKAINKAFEITSRSDEASVPMSSNCSRVYVFLSDGEPNDNVQTFRTTIKTNKRDKDVFFMVSLGSGVSSTLKDAACDVGGIYIKVEDGSATALQAALGKYYQYLAMGNMVQEVQPTRWSEPYISIPDIWGPVTSAVAPVYDKSVSPWVMIGVAAVDIPMCELESEAMGEGVQDDTDPTALVTKQGCACESEYTYEGKSYSNECTMDDWSVPWCGTGGECGFCDTQVNPGGCWDECDQSQTVMGKVEAYLKDVSNVCYHTVLADEYFEALRGTEVCTGAVDDEYTNLLATPNEFATICDTQPSVCAAWEVAGYEANDPDAGDDASPGVSVEAVDPYSTKACRSCINSMQPSCAVEYCQMGLPDDDGEEEETVCGDSAAPRAASSGLLLRSLFLVAVVFAGGVVF